MAGNFGLVELLQPDACVGRLELPVDPGLASVAVGKSCSDFFTHFRKVGDATVETLPAQRAQLDLGDVQPTAVLGGAVDFEPLGQLARSLGRKALPQGLDPVGVEVVTDPDIFKVHSGPSTCLSNDTIYTTINVLWGYALDSGSHHI